MIDNTDIYSKCAKRTKFNVNTEKSKLNARKTYLRWIQFRFVNRTIYYGWLKSKDLVGCWMKNGFIISLTGKGIYVLYVFLKEIKQKRLSSSWTEKKRVYKKVYRYGLAILYSATDQSFAI